MKAIAIHDGDDRPRLTDLPKVTPAEDEALVRTLRVGIDGTDHEVIGGAHGGFPEGESHQILGHEAVGVVEDPNGTAFDVGDLVVPTVRRPRGEPNRYFEQSEPDMAPSGSYVERRIAGAHGYMAEYFTCPEQFLIPVPNTETFAQFGFLVEPVSNSEKALEHAFAARSAFEWAPEFAIVLGNGPLGLLTLAMIEAHDSFDDVYCLGRRDRPDRSIDIIERLGSTYVDSRETPVARLADEHRPVDFIYEATGYAKHAFASIDALAPNGVAALLGIPENWSFEIDGGRLHRELVLENKAVIGSVNSNVRHFEAAKASLAEFPDWFFESLVTDVYDPDAADQAFQTDENVIKTVVEFDTY